MRVEVHFQEDRGKLDRAFLGEYARKAIQLQHPTLLRVLDVRVDEEGRWALVLPAVPERWFNLEQTRQAIEGVGAACSIALSLAEALAYLHQAQFRGAMSFDWSDCVRAARLPSGGWWFTMLPPNPQQMAAARDDKFIGNPRYTAPELLHSGGGPTPASDSFALGAVLFELLTGKALVRAPSLQNVLREVMAAAFPKPRELRPDLPAELDDFVVRAVARERDGRPSLREWSFVMEKFGGCLLPPPPVSEGPPGSGAVVGTAFHMSPEQAQELDGRADLYSLGKDRQEAGPPLTSVLEDSTRSARLRIERASEQGGFSGIYAATLDEDEAAPLPPAAETRLPPTLATRAQPRATSDAQADPVDCAVFAPPAAPETEPFLVQVFLYTPEKAAEVKALAQEFDPESRRLGFQALQVELRRGSQLGIELTIPGMVIDDPVQQLTWQGRPTSVQFGVKVGAGKPSGTCLGKVCVYLEGVPIGHVKFKLKIAPAALLEPQPLGEQARRYRQAFISYASQDRDEVLKRAQVLERCQVRFFQDILTLEPGERWEKKLYQGIDQCDLFLLFWSNAAKHSEWVEKEIRYALARKGQDDLAPPEIVPILIEGPPVPAPPTYLAHLHFNDRLLFFMCGRDSRAGTIPETAG